MRHLRFAVLLFSILILLAGCKGQSKGFLSENQDRTTGSIGLQFDFNGLAQKPDGGLLAPALAASPLITAATVTVSRDGYDPIVTNLAVVNNVASGQISGLAPGYWHIEVEVYSGASALYTGSTDVNVIAGTVVQCAILFDPVVVEPVTGSIAITVGINPMPGYTILNQAVTDVLLDRPNAKLYLLDSPAKVIGVYNADTLVRTKDLALASAPLSITLNSAGTGIFLGYPSGQIRLLDVASGQDTLVADVLMQVQHMVAVNDTYLFVTGPGSSTNMKIVNLTNGQTTATKTIFYTLTDLLYNPVVKTVYSHHTGVSPTDIHYIKIDDAAGTISSEGDSIYHGDYAFGLPLRIINNGTRITTSSGNMFTSAELAADDLRYSGNLGYSYIDLSADDALSRLYVLNSSGIQKLLVMNSGTYFVDLTMDLSGTPWRVFNTANSVIVLSILDGRYYAKAFVKTDLGL